MNGHVFRELVSGTRNDWSSSVARPLLQGIAFPYGCVVTARNFAYRHGWLPQYRTNVPVVSVGNVTLGGTGKTPFVGWIAEWYREQGKRAVLISRGYGGEHGKANDEARELALQLPDVPHLQGKNRVRSANRAKDEHRADVIVLDDGFQHRRLQRDLDVVLIDALCPWGYERLFPRGMLREPLHALQRADILCLSRADAIDEKDRARIRQRALHYAGEKPWIELAHRPSWLTDSLGQSSPLKSLQGQDVAAFCGIGNPAGFRHTLQSLGCEIVAWREFPDHHPYDAATVQELQRWLTRIPSASRIICTSKDLVKFKHTRLADRPLQALVIRCEFLQGENLLTDRLSAVLK